MAESGTFVCQNCRGTFALIDDEKARAELKHNFPGYTVEDCGVLCDECWNQYKVWHKQTFGIELQ
jgi:hypothetical protein